MKKFPSLYEAKYILYPDISYDKDQLLKFYDHYNSLDPETDKEELKILDQVIASYPKRRIQGLLNNDEEVCRMAIIEKYSRIAALEGIISGRYTFETYQKVTNFPIADYQLFVKRTKEIIDEIKALVSQSEGVGNGIGKS